MKVQTPLSRRQMLKTLGAVTAASALGVTDYRGSQGEKSSLKISRTLSAFDLADVQLGMSPFQLAQQRNSKYLLQLEPDRLLHNFRINSGLRPKAAVYGGWESVEPWIEIRCHGHTLGHYLSACAMTFAATGDSAFKQRVDYIVSDLHECQRAAKSGLICAFPDG